MTAEYVRNRGVMREQLPGVCHLCHHPGARTIDHIKAPAEWLRLYRTLAGVDGLPNLAPAHGTMGAGKHRLHNRCATCGKLCNQSRKNRPLRPAGRIW